MSNKEIVERLKEINGLYELSDDELKQKYPFITDDDLSDINRKYACLAGLTASEINYLIDLIEVEGGD